MKITSSDKKGEGVKNNHSDPMTLPIILEADALSAQDRKEELARQSKPGKSKKKKGEGENKSPKRKSAGGKTPSATKRDDREKNLISLEQKDHCEEEKNLISSTAKRDDEGKTLSSSERKKKRYDEGVKLTSSDRGEGSEVFKDNEANSSFTITAEDADDDSMASSLSKERQQFTTATDASSEDTMPSEYAGVGSIWEATKDSLRATNPVKFFKSCVARWKRRNNRPPHHPATTKDG